MSENMSATQVILRVFLDDIAFWIMVDGCYFRLMDVDGWFIGLGERG